jgi:hypothetical protein
MVEPESAMIPTLNGAEQSGTEKREMLVAPIRYCTFTAMDRCMHCWILRIMYCEIGGGFLMIGP